jgi:pyruvate/2-oxoglutarate dehydrogenase complex dihydrolipoamide dehydrogenase (E3) component
MGMCGCIILTKTGKSKISVNGKILKFHKACIATGSRPGVPSIPGYLSLSLFLSLFI